MGITGPLHHDQEWRSDGRAVATDVPRSQEPSPAAYSGRRGIATTRGAGVPPAIIRVECDDHSDGKPGKLGQALGGAYELQAFDDAPVQLDQIVFGNSLVRSRHTARAGISPALLMRGSGTAVGFASDRAGVRDRARFGLGERALEHLLDKRRLLDATPSRLLPEALVGLG